MLSNTAPSTLNLSPLSCHKHTHCCASKPLHNMYSPEGKNLTSCGKVVVFSSSPPSSSQPCWVKAPNTNRSATTTTAVTMPTNTAPHATGGPEEKENKAPSPKGSSAHHAATKPHASSVRARLGLQSALKSSAAAASAAAVSLPLDQTVAELALSSVAAVAAVPKSPRLAPAAATSLISCTENPASRPPPSTTPTTTIPPDMRNYVVEKDPLYSRNDDMKWRARCNVVRAQLADVVHANTSLRLGVLRAAKEREKYQQELQALLHQRLVPDPHLASCLDNFDSLVELRAELATLLAQHRKDSEFIDEWLAVVNENDVLRYQIDRLKKENAALGLHSEVFSQVADAQRRLRELQAMEAEVLPLMQERASTTSATTATRACLPPPFLLSSSSSSSSSSTTTTITTTTTATTISITTPRAITPRTTTPRTNS
eukprot:gnl/Spiro4/12901_TR6834_c0_g1_i1.p1 gnl/Spiro4/12901_TR6834_c0_g1~~gnl/Spiro4/12901_TR6834_c0_g1_i1.p1  ORF type:complete len:429 (-),score=98.53 gnl/Spiro4/12901_TR6834_c0_g1_i1:30-1316(-)